MGQEFQGVEPCAVHPGLEVKMINRPYTADRLTAEDLLNAVSLVMVLASILIFWIGIVG